MSYSYGSSSGMGTGYIVGPGYSYAALTSSMDPGEALDAPGTSRRSTMAMSSRRDSRGCLTTAGHVARADKHKTPSPRHRAECGTSSFSYKSLGAGLTLPRAAINKISLRAKNGDMETAAKKAHSVRRVSNASYKTAKHHSSAQGQCRPKQTRPQKKPHQRGTPKQTPDEATSASHRSTPTTSKSKSSPRLRPATADLGHSVSRRSRNKSKTAFAWGCFGG